MSQIRRYVKPKDILCPNFFIAGFSKCATFTLYHNLNRHPDINMGKFKSPDTFSGGYHWKEIDKIYKKHYGNDRPKILGDASSSNAMILYVPDRIKLCNPNAKILFLTRDPVERAYSWWRYLWNLRPGLVGGFQEEIYKGLDNFDLDRFRLEGDYVPTICPRWGNYNRMIIEGGCYEYYISKWVELFDNYMVMDLNQLKKAPEEVMNQIEWFLGVSNFDYGEIVKRNVGSETSSVWDAYPSTADDLRKFYESY